MALLKVPEEVLLEIGNFLYDLNARDDTKQMRSLMSTCRALQQSMSVHLLRRRWNLISFSAISNPYDELCRRRRIAHALNASLASALIVEFEKESISIGLADKNIHHREAIIRDFCEHACHDFKQDFSGNFRRAQGLHHPPFGTVSFSLIASYFTETLNLAHVDRQVDILTVFNHFYFPNLFSKAAGEEGFTFFSTLLQLMLHQRSSVTASSRSLPRMYGGQWCCETTDFAKLDLEAFKHSPTYHHLLSLFPRSSVKWPRLLPDKQYEQPYGTPEHLVRHIFKHLDSDFLKPLVLFITKQILKHGLSQWHKDLVIEEVPKKFIKIRIPITWHKEQRYIDLSSDDVSDSTDNPAFICFGLRFISMLVLTEPFRARLQKEDKTCIQQLLMDSMTILNRYVERMTSRVPALACQAANDCIHVLTADQLVPLLPDIKSRVMTPVPGGKRRRIAEEVDLALHACGEGLLHHFADAMQLLLQVTDKPLDPISLHFLATRAHHMDLGQARQGPRNKNISIVEYEQALETLTAHLARNPAFITSWSFLRLTHFTLSRAHGVSKRSLRAFTQALLKGFEMMASPSFDKFVSISGMGSIIEQVYMIAEGMVDARAPASLVASLERLKATIAVGISRIHNPVMQCALMQYLPQDFQRISAGKAAAAAAAAAMEEEDEDEEYYVSESAAERLKQQFGAMLGGLAGRMPSSPVASSSSSSVAAQGKEAKGNATQKRSNRSKQEKTVKVHPAEFIKGAIAKAEHFYEQSLKQEQGEDVPEEQDHDMPFTEINDNLLDVAISMQEKVFAAAGVSQHAPPIDREALRKQMSDALFKNKYSPPSKKK